MFSACGDRSVDRGTAPDSILDHQSTASHSTITEAATTTAIMNAGAANSGANGAGDANSGAANTGDANTGAANTGAANTGAANTGAAGADANTGTAGADANTGTADADANTGTAGADANTGTAGADANTGTAGADANTGTAGADANTGAAGADANMNTGSGSAASSNAATVSATSASQTGGDLQTQNTLPSEESAPSNESTRSNEYPHSQPTTKTDLVLVTSTLPTNLDPTLTNDQPSSRVMRQIFETLFTQDEDMNIIPCLAESYEFIDSTTLYVKLRQGVKFHNGKDFNAEDVKFSLERAAASPLTQAIAGQISEVIVNSDYDVTIKLAEPFSPIVAHLAHTAASIVDKDTVEAIGSKTHGKYPVGTGPFMIDKQIAGDRVELIRWDRYYGTQPAIERIIIKAVPDASGRARAVESGAADLAFDILLEDVPRIESGRTAYAIRSTSLSTAYIGFNCQKPPFDDVRVRQAVNYAIDKNELIRSVYKGAGKPSYGPLATGVWASAQGQLAPYEYDIEKSVELLNAAGLEEGFSTSIWTGEDAQSIDIARIVQTQLESVGIKCEVEVMEWPAYLSRTAAGEHEMFVLGWVDVTGDPDYGLYANFYSGKQGEAGNRSFYSNPRVDELLDAGKRESEPSEREIIYYEAQQLIRDDSPWIFVWQGEDINVARSNLRGFKNDPAGRHVLYNIYFE